MAAAGWSRTDARPWRKTTARWSHESGRWRLEHCGHPTALFPWALYDTDGRCHVNYNGKAWPDLGSAVAYVHDGANCKQANPPYMRSLRPYLHGRAA